LLLGALMRHTESGLAIPDFPLMGGQLVPRFDDQMLAHVNGDRFQLLLEPVSRAQVVFHFLHRLGAAGVGLAVIAANRTVYRSGGFPAARRLLKWINGATVVQALLGVLTVLTARSPAVASFHVLLGAALLAVTFLFLVRCLPLPASARLAAAGPSLRHG
jgi:heme A synthase